MELILCLHGSLDTLEYSETRKLICLLEKRCQRKYHQQKKCVHISKSEAKIDIKQYCVEQWDIPYYQIETGTQYKTFQPSVLEPLPSNANRRISSMIFRLRTGHCRLNSHLHRIGVRDSPCFDYCTTPETVAHLLISCPKYDRQRSILLEYSQRQNIPFSMYSLLSECEALPKIIEFVLSCAR